MNRVQQIELLEQTVKMLEDRLQSKQEIIELQKDLIENQKLTIKALTPSVEKEANGQVTVEETVNA